MAALISTRNEAGLPRWAQQLLLDYRREIEGLRKQLLDAAEGTEKAPFYYDRWDGPTFYVPHHSRLQHCNPDSDGRGVLEFQHDRGDPEWVKIYAHDGQIHVRPEASNVIKIKVERHR